MGSNRMDDQRLETDLNDLVRATFPGMTVCVEDNARWNEKSVTFTWPGFSDLLPEERFHKLVGVIPPEMRQSRMQGMVWLELVPGESIDDYLKLPRSEDSLEKEPSVYSMLVEADFFVDMANRIGSGPGSKCGGDFTVAEAVLTNAKFSASRIRDAKLVFIRHGVYCDCQVLSSVQPELAKLYSGAA